MINPFSSYSFQKTLFSLPSRMMVGLGRLYTFLKNIPSPLSFLTQRVNQQAQANFNKSTPLKPCDLSTQSITPIKPTPSTDLDACTPKQIEKTVNKTKRTTPTIVHRTLTSKPQARVQQPRAQAWTQPPFEYSAPPLQSKPTTKITEQHKPHPINQTLINVPSDGNCQLHAILKGLEIQYPHLLNDQSVDGEMIQHSHRTLRQKGLDFITKCLLEDHPLSEECYGYLDSDRGEYNSDFKRRASNFLRSDLLKIEHNLIKTLTRDKKPTTNVTPLLKQQVSVWIKHIAVQQGKIGHIFTEAENNTLQQFNQLISNRQESLEKTYTSLINQAYDIHEKLSKRIDAEVIIHSNEEFLQRCSQDSFWCSSLHLFALSAAFNIPIEVHDPLIPAKFGAQTFNPMKSELPPIQLYRSGGNHYQYILAAAH
ncbi:hypothetical protein PNK_1399 [Candidatus Protochlamydia naegleriophila]|uniref:OTU domain-containing protein n=1 Tax=Candidatus Protochlamydia naegleriophila TaxID=389348 RepID=A0A0U5JE01_9BACT|nr:hypothetical protein [Candidatus Protochlamydia naegleriophila]CUI17012.1 hypothetical protein PNK_1399 [Candidatus Protochlamydia naegleriophila]